VNLDHKAMLYASTLQVSYAHTHACTYKHMQSTSQLIEWEPKKPFREKWRSLERGFGEWPGNFRGMAGRTRGCYL